MIDLLEKSYCDFPNCGASCWQRCTSNDPCWDGFDSVAARNKWRAMRSDWDDASQAQLDLFTARATSNTP